MYYKTIQNGELTMIGKSSVVPQNAVEISEEKYNQIMAVIQTHPEEKQHMMKKLNGMYLR